MVKSTGKRSILHCGREDFRDVFREDFREDFKSQLNRDPVCDQVHPSHSTHTLFLMFLCRLVMSSVVKA